MNALVQASAPSASARYAVPPALLDRLTALVAAGPRAVGRPTVSPMTGAAVAVVPQSRPADVPLALCAARRAHQAWARQPLPHRAAVLLRVHDLVLTRQEPLLDLVQLESGKARAHAFEEIADIALVARHYGRNGAAYLAPRRTGGAFPALSRTVTSHHPVGVVGMVTPWNYPLSLPIGDALPALLAGNAVLLRPDPQAALTALYGVSLLHEAGLPAGSVQVLVGDAEVAEAVLDHSDYVCFTGSTKVGRKVGQRAGRRLVGASLELGGKNSLYVRADADLDRAAEGAVRSCFGSAGQLCMHTERVLVHEDVADGFVDRFLARVRAMRLGTALSYGIDMGSLAGPRQLERVRAHLADAVGKGARVLVGGRVRPDLGPYVFEPTVIDGVTAAMACRDEETFGPLVALYRVTSDAHAVAVANDTEYGLHAAIWTRDVPAARRLAGQLVTGTVSINEGYAAVWGSAGAPLGGRKDSGVGRRHGPEGIRRFTEVQNVTSQHGLGFGPPRGLSDAGWTRTMTGALRAMKTLGLR
ncbi:MAG: succinic semialdehyde dehydrogenase [Dermatophilaceae bacterium]